MGSEMCIRDRNIYQNDNFKKAKKYINKAISYNNKSLRALILIGDISYESKNFSDALKKYLSIYENYPEESYLVLEKIKSSYDKLNKKGDFFEFFKSIANVRSPIEAFSNIDKNSYGDLSGEEISNLYENEFLNNRVNLSQLSDYLNLIQENKVAFDNKSLNNIKTCIDKFSSKTNSHKCTQCGFASINHFWQCPSCQQWSSIKKDELNQSESSHYVV